jgi:predicted DNA-binding WGR domain protein
MTAIILHRVDPAKNMRRFYRLDVQRDLFGQWCLIREWGSSASRSGAAIACGKAECRRKLKI